MTRDRKPLPASAIWGHNAVTVVDELTAPPLTVVQYGGRWQATNGDPNDELLTASWPLAAAMLTPDAPHLPRDEVA